MARKVEPPRAWQRMLSGRRLDLFDPSPLDVEIEDIAHGLSRVARWNGQTKGDHIFSVAQHSLLVEQVSRQIRDCVSDKALRYILLHDAAEYVIGDMISPFKVVIGNQYKDTETRILSAVLLRFGLPATPSREVATLAKQADRICAHHEAVTLAGFSAAEALKYFGPRVVLPASLHEMLVPWPANVAKTRYLERFAALTKDN